jgi:hypothetical protein
MTKYSANFTLSVVDFGGLDESGGVAFLGPEKSLENKYSLASWVNLEKDSIELSSGESQKVKISIKDKESLSPGGHYAAIMAKMNTSQESQDGSISQVALDPSFSSLLFVRKVGGEIYNLTLNAIDFKKELFHFAPTAKLRFQNTGNVHVVPRGLVKIMDPLGRVVMSGVINEESGLVLPETFRIIPITLKQQAAMFIPGKYTLSVEYRYEGNDTFVTESQTIDFIPVNAMLGGLLVGGLILAGYVWYKIRKRSRKRKESSNS